MNMKLTIANTGIRTDAEGRFSLNDLHKASGNVPSQKPSEWASNKQTQDLIAEIEKAGIPAITSRQKVGSFACKELVYAYAMWISPKFHLQVIRAYDEMVAAPHAIEKKQTTQIGPVVRTHLLCVNALVKLGVDEGVAMATAFQNIQNDTGIATESYRVLLPGVEQPANLNQKQLGAEIGVSAVEIGHMLRDAGLMRDDESGNRVVTEAGRKYGEMRPFSRNGHSGFEPRWKKEVLDFLTQPEFA
jgi:hypothetical protein